MEETITVQCPWCGEEFVTFVDLSGGCQTYVEDCQVCCRPIVMELEIRGGELRGVEAQRA